MGYDWPEAGYSELAVIKVRLRARFLLNVSPASLTRKVRIQRVQKPASGCLCFGSGCHEKINIKAFTVFAIEHYTKRRS